MKIDMNNLLRKVIFISRMQINSIWIICNKPRICGLDYSSLQTIIKFCDGFCHYVHARCVEDCNRSKNH